MFPNSEGLEAAVEAVVGSNLTQTSGILYLSLYTFSWSNYISNDPRLELFV